MGYYRKLSKFEMINTIINSKFWSGETKKYRLRSRKWDDLWLIYVGVIIAYKHQAVSSNQGFTFGSIIGYIPKSMAYHSDSGMVLLSRAYSEDYHYHLCKVVTMLDKDDFLNIKMPDGLFELHCFEKSSSFKSFADNYIKILPFDEEERDE